MSQIKNIVVAIIALIIVYFFIQTANMIGAPRNFSLMAGLVVLMILYNVARRLIRGY